MGDVEQHFKSLLDCEDELRIREITKYLPDKPLGVGKLITERRYYEQLNENEYFNKVIGEAENLLGEELPELTDEIFLRYSKTGDRQVCDKLTHDRCYRIEKFVEAECLENKGRFLSSLQEILLSICKQKTWVLTAHDSNLDNFYGKDISIDLLSSALAWRMATAIYIMGNKINNEVKNIVVNEIQRRVFSPFEDMINGKREPYYWIYVKNNWNACCLAGVVGAAQTLIQSKEKRAYYIKVFEKYIVNYLDGFNEDGYCSEGLGYWGYGFSHLLCIVEYIRQITSNKINYLLNHKIYEASLFGYRMEIINGLYPSISDSSFGITPNPRNMYYISKRYGLNLLTWENNKQVLSCEGRLYETMLINFMDDSKFEFDVKNNKTNETHIRTWFHKSGLLICRPNKDTRCKMGVVLKAGDNAEHHNHNDVGAYIVAVNNSELVADVGGEVYTSRTFSAKRYESNVLNSYGHSVPLVDKKMQNPYIRTGKQEGRLTPYKAKVLDYDFKEGTDSLSLDLLNLYEVDGLQKLQRTFNYSRKSNGTLCVTDFFESDREIDFEVALITLYEYKIISNNRIQIYNGKDKVNILIECDSVVEINTDKIKENTKENLNITRIAIKYKNKTKKGKLKLYYE